jgi:glycosyltransferase involved in cell wall biosynthesis
VGRRAPISSPSSVATVPEHPDYSIIIPAYNEEDLLPKTLRTLKLAMAACPQWRGELIVTDNASTDRTAELARELGAQVVFEPHRQIARSRNSGAKASRGRFLVFVDADTEVSPTLLAAALQELASDRYWGTRLTIGFWVTLSRWRQWACGAFVFCRREAFEAVGGFDEAYYCAEEIHLSKALRRWGRTRQLKMVILKEPIVTSIRKLHWFGPLRTLGHMIRLGLMPGAMKRRDSCAFWYERPATAAKPPLPPPPTP